MGNLFQQEDLRNEEWAEVGAAPWGQQGWGVCTAGTEAGEGQLEAG